MCICNKVVRQAGGLIGRLSLAAGRHFEGNARLLEEKLIGPRVFCRYTFFVFRFRSEIFLTFRKKYFRDSLRTDADDDTVMLSTSCRNTAHGSFRMSCKVS